MEVAAERALKSSFLSDVATIQSQQLFLLDDGWVSGGVGVNNVGCDDFSVDDLLDFTDKDFKDGSVTEDEGKDSVLVSSQHRNSNSFSFSETDDDFGSLLSAELSLPADGLENLEWLSQFVDDSQSELSLLCLAGAGNFKTKTGGLQENRLEHTVQKIRGPSFLLPVPRKMRSKRSRPVGKAWSGSPSLTPESSSISSSSSYGSSSLSPFIWANPVQDNELFSSVEKPPAKKHKKKQTAASDNGSVSNVSQHTLLRRCSHCQVQKTPQWRTGPLGPKTLCNACGVRYKSGRLFPEYRPACSPTFSQDIHSNSHRKVLEMRRKKEVSVLVESGLSPMVPSC